MKEEIFNGEMRSDRKYLRGIFICEGNKDGSGN